MDNQAWLEARRTGIGGSDLAAVLGLSPWRSPLDVWRDKTGKAQPQEDNDKMKWGRLLEDLVAREAGQKLGKLVRRVNHVIRHKTLPMVGNIDRALHEQGKLPVVNGEFRTSEILECKTASEYTKHMWGEEGTDEIPRYYLPQCLHYLGLTNAEICYVAVLIGGSDYRLYKVAKDAELIGRMWDMAAKWWRDYVVNIIPPPPRTLAETASLFPQHVNKSIVASSEIEEDITNLATVKNEIESLEKTEKELKDGIASYIKDNEAIVDLSGKPLLTWKAAKGSEKTDWKAVAEELAAKAGEEGKAVINKHTGMVPGSRRMLIKI